MACRNAAYKADPWRKALLARAQRASIGPGHTPEANAKRSMPMERNPAWKGGVTIFKTHGNYAGVRYIRAPREIRPMARKDGYVMEHRLLMAITVGRLLTRTEVVNHINHNPRDNSPANLELYPTNRDHKLGEAGRFVPGVANRWSPRVLGPPSNLLGSRLPSPASP
jgi:hypothetical protein